MTAKEFFETAREAARDAERCRSQLVALEARSLSLGGGQQGSRVRSTPDPHRMQRAVVAYVDREESLGRRMDADYATIDMACLVLYGDGEREGLDVARSPVEADALWWRYLDDATWATVGRAVGYSPSQCQTICSRALSWIDETRFAADVRRRAERGR